MPEPTRTILLVEDESIIALQEAMQLRKAGYEVVHSPTGEEAIERVEASPCGIDLILMDIDLGRGMDGTEAAERILGRHDIPILFLSSHTDPLIVRKTEQITNYGYVVKASSITVLDASIKMAFKLFAAMKKVERTHGELALSQDKFSKAFHLNPDAININRLSDGEYIDVNEGFTQIMGYAREDVLGRSSLAGDLGIWVHQADRERLVRGLIEQGEVSNLESEFRKKDGSTTRGLMSARIIEIGGERCIISITRDMGTWMATQEELVRTKAILDSTMDSQDDIYIVSIDPDFNCLYANKAYREIKREVLGIDIRPGTCLLDNLERDIFLRDYISHFRRALAGESIRVVESYDSLNMVVESKYSPILSESGEPIGATSFASDITQKRSVEKRLEYERSLNAILMDAIPDTIYFKDCCGRFIRANKAQYEKAGCASAEELEGKTDFDIFSRESAQASYSDEQEIMRSGKPLIAREERMRWQDDSVVWYSATKVPFFDKEGRTLGILGISRDITERKRFEEALKKSREQFQLAIEASRDAIWDADIAAGEAYFSPAYYEMLGYTAKDFPRMDSWLGYVHPEDRATVVELNRDCVENRRQGFDAEYRMRAKDGQWKWLNAIGKAVGRDPSGRAMRIVGTIREITGQKEREEELRQSQAGLTQLVKAEEVLMRELQHRVKNSLALVSSLLELAMGELTDGAAINVLEDTVSRVRSMSSIYERLYLSDNATSIDFGLYVEDLASSIFATFSPDTERIALAVEAEHIEIDTKRAISLGLILNELLVNALKYAFPGERRGLVTVSLKALEGRVSLTVQDDGVGIEDPHMLEASPTMGMTLIRLFAEQIGARLESELSRGTRISIVFGL